MSMINVEKYENLRIEVSDAMSAPGNLDDFTAELTVEFTLVGKHVARFRNMMDKVFSSENKSLEEQLGLILTVANLQIEGS